MSDEDMPNEVLYMHDISLNSDIKKIYLSNGLGLNNAEYIRTDTIPKQCEVDVDRIRGFLTTTIPFKDTYSVKENGCYQQGWIEAINKFRDTIVFNTPKPTTTNNKVTNAPMGDMDKDRIFENAHTEENKRLRYEIEKLSVLKNACQTVVCDREILGNDGVYNVIRRAWIDYNLNDRGEP